MKRTLSALLLLLAGCSSEGGTEQMKILRTAFAEVFPSSEPETPTAPAPALTRAQVDELGVAMIRARLLTDEGKTILTGATEHDGYISYISRFQQMITMRGSRVTGTRGLGYDLLSTHLPTNDPVVAFRPLAEWPETLTLRYRYPGPGLSGVTIPVTCRIEPGQAIEVEIVERRFEGRLVDEVCEGPGVSFTNTHFVENRTGVVWKSVQWLGPDQGAVDIEIVEPFG